MFFLKKTGQPWPLIFNNNFTEKIVGFSGIQTHMVRVEGKLADHLTNLNVELSKSN